MVYIQTLFDDYFSNILEKRIPNSKSGFTLKTFSERGAIYIRATISSRLTLVHS